MDTVVPSPGDISAIFSGLDTAAQSAKVTGHVYLFVTLLIGGLILWLFVYETHFYTVSYVASPPGPNFMVLASIRDTLAEINKVTDNDTDLRKTLVSILSRHLYMPENTESPIATVGSVVIILSGIVIRIGAVLIGIFLIQIMVGFTRYYYRVADHFRMCSMSIKLSAGRLSELKEVIPLLIPSRIEFGKMPTSPIEKMAETALRAIGEIAQKFPTR